MKVLSGNRKQLSGIVAAAALLVLLPACASHHAYLVPAPSATLANGGQAAMASANQISIKVVPNDWHGRPRDLYRRVTPLKVRLQNHSNRPLRIVYEDFELRTPAGKTLAALPPSEIKGTQYIGANRLPQSPHFVDAAWRQDKDQDNDVDRGGTAVVITPGFGYNDFYYAPYWGYGYAGLGPWPYAWAPNFGYYNTYYPYMRAVHLPTRAMLKKGIPEGVVGPGGYVDGFLYFKKVNPDLNKVEFVAHLQDAKTGRQFGTIRIPFAVKSK